MTIPSDRRCEHARVACSVRGASRRSLTARTFADIDADGGGALDNKELVQAWQKATGEELTPEQAQDLIDEVDQDKNGTLDQDEFVALIRKRCEQPLRSFADQFPDQKLIEIFESECRLPQACTQVTSPWSRQVIMPRPGTPFVSPSTEPCDTWYTKPLPSPGGRVISARGLAPLAVYDDDGNNEMDADELVVAWKKVTNKKISPAQAQVLINQGATNGNSTLDKDEFVQLVRAHA